MAAVVLRARVENSPGDYAFDRVRVTVVDKAPHSVMVWNGATGQWVDVPHRGPGVQLPPDVPPALDLPDDVARVVYEALRSHFGDADVEPVRALTTARAESEARRQLAEDALRDIALSTRRLA